MSNQNYKSKKPYPSKNTKNGKKRYTPKDKDNSKGKDYQEYDASKETSTYVGSENDPKWYNRNSRLIQDATKISFATQLGKDLDYNTNPILKVGIDTSPIPGVMSLLMINTTGIATSATDGVNIATAGLFQYVRKNLSTVASYAPADVMVSTLAVDEVYSMYANITRLFGLINAYSAINLYFPNDLIKAGYAFDDAAISELRENLNDYRAQFNNLIYKASTLYLPTDFTVTSRHAWLYTNYFTDAESAKSQMYIHRMYAHHYYEDTDPQGSALYTRLNGNTMVLLLSQFNDMIDRLRNSDSFLRIQADMKRAFERSSTWKLAYVDEGYMVLPTYSEEVLMQINNTVILPTPGDESLPNWNLAAFNITQSVDQNIILFNPVWGGTSPTLTQLEKIMLYYLNMDKMINVHKADVTSDDIAELTRNTVQLSLSIVGTAWSGALNQCGVDLCVGSEMIIHGVSTEPFLGIFPLLSDPVLGPALAPSLASYSMFDWAPTALLEVNWDPVLEISMLRFCTDLENYTVVDGRALARLHANIICSMWSIPEIGGFNG